MKGEGGSCDLECWRNLHKKKGSGGGPLTSIVPPGPGCEIISCSQDLPPNICPLGETCWMDGVKKLQGPPAVSYPSEIILHPLDSNVVSNVKIYDYSYLPPKPIGYTIVSYKKNGDFQIDPYVLLNMAGDEALSEVAKHLFVEYVKKPIAAVGMSLPCSPECPVAYAGYQVVDNIRKINSAITYEAHLVNDTVYYPPPSPIVLEFPVVEYNKIK